MYFFDKLNLNVNFNLAIQVTVLNDKSLDGNTKETQVGYGHFKSGVEITKINPEKYQLIVWTVENQIHTKSCILFLTPEGKLISGNVNCFALGWAQADQRYVDELLDEFASGEIHWDHVE